jgi:hypothetical protein
MAFATPPHRTALKCQARCPLFLSLPPSLPPSRCPALPSTLHALRAPLLPAACGLDPRVSLDRGRVWSAQVLRAILRALSGLESRIKEDSAVGEGEGGKGKGKGKSGIKQSHGAFRSDQWKR